MAADALSPKIVYAVEHDQTTSDVTIRFFPHPLFKIETHFSITLPKNWADQLADTIRKNDARLV